MVSAFVWVRKVRKRSHALDSLGNTTAATGKGFAIFFAGSRDLPCLLLILKKPKQLH